MLLLEVKQAGQEKSFINKLKSNANADDGLQKQQ